MLYLVDRSDFDIAGSEAILRLSIAQSYYRSECSRPAVLTAWHVALRHPYFLDFVTMFDMIVIIVVVKTFNFCSQYPELGFDRNYSAMN